MTILFTEERFHSLRFARLSYLDVRCIQTTRPFLDLYAEWPHRDGSNISRHWRNARKAGGWQPGHRREINCCDCAYVCELGKDTATAVERDMENPKIANRQESTTLRPPRHARFR